MTNNTSNPSLFLYFLSGAITAMALGCNFRGEDQELFKSAQAPIQAQESPDYQTPLGGPFALVQYLGSQERSYQLYTHLFSFNGGMKSESDWVFQSPLPQTLEIQAVFKSKSALGESEMWKAHWIALDSIGSQISKNATIYKSSVHPLEKDWVLVKFTVELPKGVDPLRLVMDQPRLELGIFSNGECIHRQAMSLSEVDYADSEEMWPYKEFWVEGSKYQWIGVLRVSHRCDYEAPIETRSGVQGEFSSGTPIQAWNYAGPTDPLRLAERIPLEIKSTVHQQASLQVKNAWVAQNEKKDILVYRRVTHGSRGGPN
jgi:hypothetical protein